MGLIGHFIKWILSLFGPSRALPETSVVVVKSADGADLVRIDAELQWADRNNTNVPRNAWADDFGPLPGPRAFDDFVFHQQEFDEIRVGDPLEAEKRLLSHGYRSVGQYYRVRTTMMKHHGTPTGPMVNDATFSSQAFMAAVMRAGQRKLQARQQATIASNPGILAPIEGISVDRFALISARAAQNPPQEQFLALLAQHKLDVASWNRVNSQWTDRMSKDTSGAIAGAYSKAFMSSGQG